MKLKKKKLNESDKKKCGREMIKWMNFIISQLKLIEESVNSAVENSADKSHIDLDVNNEVISTIIDVWDRIDSHNEKGPAS